MKITTSKIEQASAGEFDEIKSTISKANLGFALGALSKNLYSNPIGSFIREIASNAVDANTEAGVDNPIIINIYQEEENWYISFKDEGCGLSPKKFKSVYMSWFNSDKRDSNDAIGGWGLGSKSPLGYKDSFQIDTIFNNVEYHYVLVNQQPVPSATLISSDTVDKPNGTTITIELEREDLYKVHTECVNQLTYFNNVIVKSEDRFYNNNFTIYEADNYKIREDRQPYGNDMHICLGQVCYPINWKILELEKVEVPVGIKFDIGSIPVTLSREEISYSDDEVKKFIKDKIMLITKQLKEKYQQQLQLATLQEYYNHITSTYAVKLKIATLEIVVNFKDVEAVYVPLNLKFKKTKFLNIASLYSGYDIVNKKISDCKNHNRDFFSSNNFIANGNFNFYDTMYIGNSAIYKRNKLTRKIIYDIADAAGLVFRTKASNSRFEKEGLKEGATKKVLTIVKEVDEYVKTKFKQYNGAAPDWWIKDYKESQKQLAEDRKGVITSYTYEGSRITNTYAELMDKYKFILYIDRNEEIDKILHYYFLFENLPKFFTKDVGFFILSPSVINKYKTTKRRKSIFVPVENVFKVKKLQSFFFRLKLSSVVDTFLRPYYNTFRLFNKNYYNIYRKISDKYGIHYKTIYHIGNYYKKYDIDLVIYFNSNLQNITRSKNKTHYIYEEYFNELEEFGKKVLPLSEFSNSVPPKYLKYIIRNLGITKIDFKHY
jgi:hypothetical protein